MSLRHTETVYFSQNLLIDNNRDFVTLEDDQGQQRIREQTEQHRKGWDLKPLMAFIVWQESYYYCTLLHLVQIM